MDHDDEIARLYALPLDRFTAERNALAKELKRSGDEAGAAEVAALGKPTLAAWTVNRLAHEHRRDVDLLLDAGKRLVDAQQASIAQGERGELDAAQAAFRHAVATLADAAASDLGERATAATLAKVSETLRSAATDPTGRELLARGRFEHELSATGWDVVASLAPAPAERAATPRKRAAGAAAEEAAARAARGAERRSLERELTTARRRLREAQRREAAANERLEQARAARVEAEAGLAALERRLGELRG